MKYAVIELAGTQFIVSEGDKLKVNRLSENEGEIFSLTPLLLVSEGDVFIGQPNVEKAEVEFKILEHKRDTKIEVRRFKSKSRYRRKKGHRQPISLVEVVRIKGLPSEALAKEGAQKGVTVTEGAEGLEELKLSTRTRNALEKAGIKSAAELEKMSKEEILKIKGVGEKAVEEIVSSL